MKSLAALASGLIVLAAGRVPATAQEAPTNLRPTRDVELDIATTRRIAGRTERLVGRAA